MIKERLMKALKEAADAYNGGMGANDAVAKAAEAADFNTHQTERLVEMFNTLSAINQEKDASDPTGACELASKNAVAKILLDGAMGKAASAPVQEDPLRYSFYVGDPVRTNRSIEARASGLASMTKAASADSQVAPEIDVSQRSLYKIISEKIDFLKSASDAADEVARVMHLEVGNMAVKIAKEIESPFANPEAADMFKCACKSEKAIKLVGEYSTKVAESKGGRFAGMEVLDASPVEDLLKTADEIEKCLSQIPEYERKRDLYMSKASEAENSMKEILGLSKVAKKASVADFFNPGSVTKKAGEDCGGQPAADPGCSPSLTVKIAELIRKSGVSAEEVGRLAEDLEKDAAPKFFLPLPSMKETYDALNHSPGVDNERKIELNVRRSIILADLMANDPIIRDADPNMVFEAYKTMVMSSPRVSLDKSQVRAFLRSAANSVAISPADAKLISDVDKGISVANVDRLTARDSSIKDSNII